MIDDIHDAERREYEAETAAVWDRVHAELEDCIAVARHGYSGGSAGDALRHIERRLLKLLPQSMSTTDNLDLCPMGCGRITDDVAGGPCSECWDLAQ